MVSFPFRIRAPGKLTQKAIVIKAKSYGTAIKKLRSLFPKFFILPKYAIQMILTEAKEEAKVLSTQSPGTPIYVYNDSKTEEVEVSRKKPKANELLHTFMDGAELTDQDINELPDAVPSTTTAAKAEKKSSLGKGVSDAPKKASVKKQKSNNEVMAVVTPKNKNAKPAKKSNTGKKSREGVPSDLKLKVGAKVDYDGKKFEIKRLYTYKDRPYAIIANDKIKSKQVSANSLVK
jgi:hypothetical protein